MKLICLGTGHGVPAPDRYTSCYVLEAGGKLYIFDAGAPVTDLLLRRGEDLKKIKGFFCSHFHGDHVDGGITLISLCGWYFMETTFDVWLPDELSRRLIRQHAELCDDVSFEDNRIRLNVTEPGLIFDDGTVRVSAIPVMHITKPDKRSYAFDIRAEGKRILYTGDLSHGLKHRDFPEVAFSERFDLILTEAAHFSVDALAQCLDRVAADTVAAVHIFPLDKIPQLRALEEKYPFRLLTPSDGDEIQL